MNMTTLVVKQENDIDAQVETYFTSSTPDSCEIKPEIPFQVKTESTVTTLNTTNLVTNNGGSYALPAPQLVENFVIYELEPGAPTTGKPSKTTYTKVAPTTAATKKFQHQPPILLNAKLRKQPRVGIQSASSSVLPESGVVAHGHSSMVTQHPTIPNAITELKVKCFCRLGNAGANTCDATSLSNGHELKGFFEQMFNETRKLTREQQRTIKMELLEAICEAEERLEEGKCCDKCCPESK